MKLSTKKTVRLALVASAIGAAFASVGGAADSKANFSGAGWTQYGMIVKSMDTAEKKELDNRGMLGTGAQFAIQYQASEKLGVTVGLGVGSGHNIAARATNGFYAPMGTGPYVANANAKYSFWDEEGKNFFLQLGYFPYDYATEAQNFGLYLVRGPVYPGLLVSGFETKNVLPVANTLGLQLHHRSGMFEHEFLLTFDSEWYPYWDISPIYHASLHLGDALRIGAGTNLYHQIPVDKKMTTQDIIEVAYVDTVAKDTTYISFKGIKVGADFVFDPKALMGGSDLLGAEDLKVYGEVAVLGLDGDKAHNALYGPVSKRMPMMFGFNLPAFKVLDKLNVEVEYYGAQWVDDPSIYNHTSGPKVTPVPKKNASDTNTTKDNFKWSIYASRVIADHVKISAQVASDHFRPGIFQGYGDNNPPLNTAPFFSPSEFYWTTKIAYFF